MTTFAHVAVTGRVGLNKILARGTVGNTNRRGFTDFRTARLEKQSFFDFLLYSSTQTHTHTHTQVLLK